MGFLLACARKDLKRRLADPLGFVVWIGMPLLLSILISALAGDSATPTAHVLLVNEDESDFTDLLVTGLTRGAASDDVAIAFEEVDRATGDERIGDGDATALLVLPAGFASAVLNNEPTTLRLVTNPAQAIFPEIVIEGLDIVREGAFYAQRVLGEPIREMAAGPPPGQDFFDSAVVARFAAEINDRMIAMRGLFDTPLFELDLDAPTTAGGTADGATDADDAAESSFSLARFLVPGMIVMALLFIAQGISADLWIEKNEGTLRRAISAPQSIVTFIAGKLASGVVVMSVVATAALAAASVFFDVAPAHLPVAVIWCTFVGTSLLGLLMFVATLASTHRTANLIAMMLVFPLMMLGGSFFPFDSMPPWMRAIGVWTPNGLAVRQLDDLLFGSVAAGSLAQAIVVVAATGLLGIVLCAWRARRFVVS